MLITGCSSGIGLATALAVARAGWPVIAGVKSERELGELPARLAAEPLPIEILVVDVASADSVAAAIESVRLKHGKLAALVNNAGVSLGGFFEDVADDELRELFEVNVFGTVRLTRAAIPLLRAGAPSSIVTLSSMAGRMGVPGMSAYHGSKFALEGLYECLRYELKPERIGVTLVEPGLIRTTILDTGTRLARRFDDPASPNRARAQKLWTDFRARFARTAKPPETVANAIVKLLGDEDPPLRVPVGADARVILALFKLLPEWLAVKLWTKLAG